MISLGIICYQGHSSAAALVRDGVVLAAVAEERFSRRKSDDSFPEQSINWLLKSFNLSVKEIDHVAVSWSPTKTLIGQLLNLHNKSLGFLLEKRNGGNVRSRLEKFLLISGLKSEFKKRYQYNGKFSYVDHHLSHAISAFVQSGKDDCIVMVADGMGEQASTTIYEFNRSSYKILYRDLFPHSLGIFYSAATQFLGFTPDSDEYKVMGMAAYSQSDKYFQRMASLYRIENGHFFLETAFFEIHKKANQFYSGKFSAHFPDCNTDEEKTAFAFALQRHLNFIVVEILKLQKNHFSSRHFATSGGVFLNCLLNQHLRNSELFESYSFFPVADDNGTAIGAAQFVQWQKTTLKPVENLYLGPLPDFENEAGKLLDGVHSKKTTLQEIASLLADGHVVGMVKGKMEFGHRALGNRSILASPQRKEMKDVINQKVKMREPFRPFAPSILEENVSDYFEGAGCFPFMIETLNGRPQAKIMAPAIIHEDGTSRIQTVSKKDNPDFYELLKEFHGLTGCPILLNTSFNLNGMPVVCTAEDAMNCFKKTNIDFLVIEDVLIWK